MQRSLPINSVQIMFEFPSIMAIDEKINDNLVMQQIIASSIDKVTVEEFINEKTKGYIFLPSINGDEPILVVNKSEPNLLDFKKCILINFETPIRDGQTYTLDQTKCKWLKHPALNDIPEKPINYDNQLAETINTWKDAFSFQTENESTGIQGLRSPQIGAIHAVHAHWTVSDFAATIVMPTGVGKTETMLSLLISQQCSKLLVIVPTDALRDQLSNKFISLGILHRIGVLPKETKKPIVGILKHKCKSVKDVDEFFEKCHVIITTMSIAGQCSEEVQDRMATHCKYLFIDEAHHVSATTWNAFRKRFSKSRIVQFTATPFRNDGKSIEGKLIYNYPLKKAQEEGYFRPISFKTIIENDPTKHDLSIATVAIEQLKEDYDKGHILMARVSSIKRAEEVYKIYQQYPEFHPVRIHTGLPQNERVRIRHQILIGETRIIVCVDMLGEGFDLPELKIAAFHDIRKSLPVTLQLAGRFTRTKKNLGNPTFIANIAQADVNEELRDLYSRDPDWNSLLPRASNDAIDEEANLWEFLEGFEKFPGDISFLNFRPALSAVVYKTKCENWKPDNFRLGIKGLQTFQNVYHDINRHNNTLVIITNKKVFIDWAQMDEIYTWAWDLYVLFWDQQQNLLFIHSSSNAGYYLELAKAVCGEDVEQIRGGHVFRCLSGINRLTLQNVGLLKTLGRLIRYEMRAGSDVEPALTEVEKRNTIKSNIFGAGFENGSKTTIGCSYKGRIWSRQTSNLKTLSDWCSLLGSKLIDEKINPDDVLKGTLVPEEIFERPRIYPIGIEWPEIVYIETDSAFQFVFDQTHIPLILSDINLINPAEDGELIFEIRSGEVFCTFRLIIIKKGETSDYSFVQINKKEDAFIEYHSNRFLVSEFFEHNPPTIWFSDGSSLQGNRYIKLKQDYPPYPVEKIEAWNWENVDLSKESQGFEKLANSIQFRVIQELKRRQFSVIFDDDDNGESADIVGINYNDSELNIELYHCKYSTGKKPGQRIKDLYEVCGQAQKNNHWARQSTDLFTHLLKREPRRYKNNTYSRFELGTIEDLIMIREISRRLRTKFKIFIVQPGLSKLNASNDQLRLLSVTENYLMETYMIPFGVIASP
jgi:superfamily II DNA or RNA helicase